MKTRCALLALVLLVAGLSACTTSATAPEPDRTVLTETTAVADEVGFAGGMGNGH